MPAYLNPMSSPGAAKTGVNIEAWTEETIESIRTLRISSASFSSPKLAHGTSAPLEIPLDEDHDAAPKDAGELTDDAQAARTTSYVRRREPLRRDSMKGREALLKGKPGSRRRQKWENDRLIGNPWAEPPTAADWDIRPTYNVHTVPYFLAPMWDERAEQSHNWATEHARKAANLEAMGGARVPRELREKLKRSKGAKTLLQDLEQEVRKFVKSWEEKKEPPPDDGFDDVHSSDEEEIVFIGRNGKMKDEQPRTPPRSPMKLILESPIGDQGASFGRWLVHSIADYYDLSTWSVTKGDPARREAYVGIRDAHMTERWASSGNKLPRPLWGLV